MRTTAQVPMEAKREPRWSWSYKVLGTEPESSAKAVHILQNWDISPAPESYFQQDILHVHGTLNAY